MVSIELIKRLNTAGFVVQFMPNHVVKVWKLKKGTDVSVIREEEDIEVSLQNLIDKVL